MSCKCTNASFKAVLLVVPLCYMLLCPSKFGLQQCGQLNYSCLLCFFMFSCLKQKVGKIDVMTVINLE